MRLDETMTLRLSAPLHKRLLERHEAFLREDKFARRLTLSDTVRRLLIESLDRYDEHPTSTNLLLEG